MNDNIYPNSLSHMVRLSNKQGLKVTVKANNEKKNKENVNICIKRKLRHKRKRQRIYNKGTQTNSVHEKRTLV